LHAPSITAELNNSTVTVKVSDIKSGGQFLIDLLAEKNITPTRFEVMEPTLESLFMEAVR
jgi:ABC-2 type transport system ATP-binding protein